MRMLAGRGLGALVAIVGLLAWGGATGGRGWAVFYLVCLGGIVIPTGFTVGCLAGAAASLMLAVRRRFERQLSGTGQESEDGNLRDDPAP